MNTRPTAGTDSAPGNDSDTYRMLQAQAADWGMTVETTTHRITWLWLHLIGAFRAGHYRFSLDLLAREVGHARGLSGASFEHPDIRVRVAPAADAPTPTSRRTSPIDQEEEL